MIENMAGLAAIIENPACDVERGKYADWLEENGEAERAEFIRGQCCITYLKSESGGKHANHSEAYKNCYLCYEVECLSKRERELLFSYGPKWSMIDKSHSAEVIMSDNWRYNGTPGVLFSRGFIARVRCTLDQWRGGECDHCESGERGIWVGDNISSPTDYIQVACEHCNGTGRTPGIGPRIAQRNPVEFVEVVDAYPMIPIDIFAVMDTTKPNKEALSDALIRWARQQLTEAK